MSSSGASVGIDWVFTITITIIIIITITIIITIVIITITITIIIIMVENMIQDVFANQMHQPLAKMDTARQHDVLMSQAHTHIHTHVYDDVVMTMI